MSRARIDLGGGGGASSGNRSSRDDRSGSKKPGNNDRIKVIAASVIGVIALGLIGFQLLPTLLSGGSSADPNAPELTEPEPVDTSNNVPGSVQEPVIPKPRGSAKRPAGG